MTKALVFLGIVIIVGVVAIGILAPRLAFSPTEDFTGTLPPNEEGEEVAAIEVIAEDLEIPWEIVWLPGGDMLITERPGQVIRIGEDRQAIEITGVRHVGEGGLLGMALHPDFESNSFLYLYLTTQSGGGLTNRVERYQLDGTTLSNRTTIIENIPGSQFHDGGRIAFGPDGYLYITTGDAGQSDSAQDTSSLAGKILRLNDDGSVPTDNPFSSPVYSYGHRNPQGIAWDDTGQLWATEHGRSGLRSGFDELNRIEAGANYGWSNVEGDEEQEGMVSPAAHSGASTTWAPSGMAHFNGTLWFAGLRGQSVYSASVEGDSVGRVVTHLGGVYGRLRTVAVGPDGLLYILTNNTDGRGSPKSGDDKVIRINPEAL